METAKAAELAMDRDTEAYHGPAEVRGMYLIDRHFINRLEELETMWREATEECEWGLEHNDMDHYNRFQTKRNEATGRIMGCIQAMLPHIEEA